MDATPTFDPSVMLFIALSFGFSLAVNVWVLFQVWGLFNLTVAFVPRPVGSLSLKKIGGASSFPTPLGVSTPLSAGTSAAQGLFIQKFPTAELMLNMSMFVAGKHCATLLAPIVTGAALFVIEFACVYFTGGSATQPGGPLRRQQALSQHPLDLLGGAGLGRGPRSDVVQAPEDAGVRAASWFYSLFLIRSWIWG